jgi:hypothetical protein
MLTSKYSTHHKAPDDTKLSSFALHVFHSMFDSRYIV